MTQPKLEIVDLVRTYDGGDVVAVDGISMTVDRGETVALLGPSGCGKSTTLNMIVGLEEPSSGDIHIDGQSIVGKPAGQRNIGLVFQDYAVFTHMSVAKNLSFGLEVAGLPRAEINRRVGETVELLGLQSLLKERASNLGGSQLQRVAIGRTLVTQPSILLLDEPLSNLEAEARAAMRRELRRLQSEIGLTIIYVTHDQTEALSLANRVAVMNAGKIQQFDLTASVYDAPENKFVAGFIGDPAMNLIAGTIQRSASELRFVSNDVSMLLPAEWLHASLANGQPVTLGIRPEALWLTDPSSGSIPATVLMIAPKGPEASVTVAAMGAQMVIVVPADDMPEVGAQVGIKANPSAITLFHGDTGLNLHRDLDLEVAA